MCSVKVTVVCLLASLPAIAGITCFNCTDYFWDTDNQIVQNAIKMAGLSKEPDCRAPVDISANKLSVKNCTDTPGTVATCYFAIASASFSAGGETIEVTYTDRGCMNINAEYNETCQESTQSSTVRGLGNIEGSICYCSTDNCNGQARLVPTLALFFFTIVALFTQKE